MLETLVQIASFGTAGVCVLAIFNVGRSMEGLPADASEARISLVRRYQTIVVIIAIISALSGAANAYFNQAKIAAARDELKGLQREYTRQSEKVMTQRATIEKSMASLRQQLQTAGTHTPMVPGTLDKLDSAVKSLQIEPLELVMKRIQPEKLTRPTK